MKRAVLAVSMLAVAAGAAWAGVGKEEIKKLLKAGVGDDVILSYLKANGPVDKLSADDLIELKEAGASEKVLQAAVGGKGEDREPEKKEEPRPETRRDPEYTPPPAYEPPRERREVVYVDRSTTVYVPSTTPYFYPPAAVWCHRHWAYDHCSVSADYYRPYRSYGWLSYTYPSTRVYWSSHGHPGHRHRTRWSVGWCW